MRRLGILMATVCVAFGVAAATGVKTYRADDQSAVRFVGRTAAGSGDGSVRFDWSGVYAETELDGRALAMRLSDTGKSYFDIFVDGKHAQKIKSQGTDTIVTIADGLSRGVHKIAIRKCTEGETGMTTIHEFILPKGGTMTAAKPRGRHIEFIGNSLSAGFGTEGKNPREPFSPESENCNLAYSTIVPRYFDADYTIIAHSGRGAVRNYGDSVRVSRNAMRHKFLQTFDEDTTVRWSFDGYRPDLVVINLGANDFSTEPHPYRREFVDAYSEIIDSIMAKYGAETPILSVMPYAIDTQIEPMFADILQRNSKANIHFIRMPVDYINWDSDRGAVWHPNYQGQKKMAMLIIPYVATITGWDFPTRPVE